MINQESTRFTRDKTCKKQKIKRAQTWLHTFPFQATQLTRPSATYNLVQNKLYFNIKKQQNNMLV